MYKDDLIEKLKQLPDNVELLIYDNKSLNMEFSLQEVVAGGRQYIRLVPIYVSTSYGVDTVYGESGFSKWDSKERDLLKTSALLLKKNCCEVCECGDCVFGDEYNECLLGNTPDSWKIRG